MKDGIASWLLLSLGRMLSQGVLRSGGEVSYVRGPDAWTYLAGTLPDGRKITIGPATYSDNGRVVTFKVICPTGSA